MKFATQLARARPHSFKLFACPLGLEKIHVGVPGLPARALGFARCSARARGLGWLLREGGRRGIGPSGRELLLASGQTDPTLSLLHFARKGVAFVSEVASLRG